MTKIYLHIGTPKTGTTAIQHFLCINQKKFLNKGYLYPLSGTGITSYKNTQFANHFLLPRAIKNELTLDNNLKKQTESLNQEWPKLINEINAELKDNIIISAEGFAPLSFDEVKLVKQYLSNYDVKIIVYLRKQDEFIQSLYNQLVKIGIYSSNIHQFVQEKQPEFINYDHLLKTWTDLFGKENIIVRIYEKEQLKNRDLIQDFIDAINYKNNEDLTNGFLQTVAQKNESPSIKTTKLMRLLNLLLPEQILFLKEIRKKVNTIILKLSLKNTRLTTRIFLTVLDFFIKDTQDDLLSTQDKIEIMKKYEESNLTVAREYLGRENTGLFYSNIVKNKE